MNKKNNWFRRFYAVITVFFMCSITMFSVSAYADPPTYGVYGYVTDALTGNPVYQATVNANGVIVQTNNQGYYYAGGFHTGTYSISVSHTGFNQASGTFTINGGHTLKNFQLSRANGLSGYVYDTMFNRLSGATVTVKAHNWQGSTTTDATGFYWVAPFCLAVMPIDVRAAKAHYWTGYEHTNMVYGNVRTANFFIKPTYYQTIILAATYITRGSLTDTQFTIPSCTAYFVQSSTLTFGYSGGISYGLYTNIAMSTQSTMIQTYGQSQPLTPSQTGYIVYGQVEITGASTGQPGANYDELSVYVVANSLDNLGSTPITTPDPVLISSVSANLKKANVGPGSLGAENKFDATSAVCTTTNFGLNGVLFDGGSVTLSVTRATFTGTGKQVGVSIANSYTNLYLHYYYEIEQPITPSDHAVIMHVWYYSKDASMTFIGIYG